MTRRECLLVFAAGLRATAAETLAAQWRRIAADTDGTVGAAALHLGSGRRLSLNGDDHFPMASVCKLPIAMHMLALVDEGKFSRQSMIEVIAQDVTLEVSEVGHRWPKQKQFPLDELVALMVARSDNTAVETLYRVGGGSPAIMARLRAWHTESIRIDRNERQSERDFSKDPRQFLSDPRDTATPDGTVGLLARLCKGELLSAASTARLIQILETTSTGPARIKGMLPAGVVVAHKTGTTGTSHGLNGGTNDAGVIRLPQSGDRLALAIYLKGGRQDLPARERIIARIALAAFESPSLT
jgi:beta-lactamase class A